MNDGEAFSRRVYPRVAQDVAFRNLRFNVSDFALKKLATEWDALRQMPQNDINLGPCNCEVLLRFGISCRHYLRRAYLTGEPIPRSLLHPRWWLNGPQIRFTNWLPKYDEGEVF